MREGRPLGRLNTGRTTNSGGSGESAAARVRGTGHRLLHGSSQDTSQAQKVRTPPRTVPRWTTSRAVVRAREQSSGPQLSVAMTDIAAAGSATGPRTVRSTVAIVGAAEAQRSWSGGSGTARVRGRSGPGSRGRSSRATGTGQGRTYSAGTCPRPQPARLRAGAGRGGPETRPGRYLRRTPASSLYSPRTVTEKKLSTKTRTARRALPMRCGECGTEPVAVAPRCGAPGPRA